MVNIDSQKTPPKFSTSLFYAIIILGFIFLYLRFGRGVYFMHETTMQKFETEMLSKYIVKKLDVVNNETVEVYLKPEYLSRADPRADLNMPYYFFKIGSIEFFEHKMDEWQKYYRNELKVDITYTKRTNWFREMLPWLLPVVILFFLWRFFINKTISNMNGGARSVFSFGKSPGLLADKSKGLPTFKDVAGYEEAKTEIMEIVDFLKNPDEFKKLGAKIPKGVLLIGPPGTGKTLMAKAVAGEAAVPFFSLSGSEFVEMFVGVGASRVRDLFRIAKSKAPCIIFIDELDTVGRYREKASSLRTNDERESTLNQLLTEMDGFDSDSRIIVMAATNRADILDPALVRAGRFDRHVYLELPNKSEREAIFKVHMAPLKYNKQLVDAALLAQQTPGFSGADIANVCNEAALIASRQKKEMIELNDFDEALEKVVGGLEKKSMVITAKEKKIIAYHESGHALVSWMLPTIDPVIKLSIIPRGTALGSTRYLPEERRLTSKSEFEDHLCVLLGGRAAEELEFEDIYSGALNDLERATQTAYTMVTSLGFSSRIGNLSFYSNEIPFQKPYSDTTAKMIDEEVKILIGDAYDKAKEIIFTHKNRLDQLAALLLEKESLGEDDIKGILGKRPA